jgi:hypothetical protein
MPIFATASGMLLRGVLLLERRNPKNTPEYAAITRLKRPDILLELEVKPGRT